MIFAPMNDDRSCFFKHDFLAILVDFCMNFFVFDSPDPGGRNQTDPDPKHCVYVFFIHKICNSACKSGFAISCYFVVNAESA